MKNICIIFIAVSTLLLCFKENKEAAFFSLHNAIDFARTETVIISKKQLLEKLLRRDESHILFVANSQVTEIFYQLDDIHQDGIWDEVTMQVNFDSNEEETFVISAFAKARTPQFKKKQMYI